MFTVFKRKRKQMPAKFKIESVKWSWSKPVKSKDVYRDDEFVRTKTKARALKAIDFLMSQPKGLTYTITVKRDGEYFTYFRHSMPCLGGLVKYRDSHGERHFMNPYFPRDICVPFPEGEIVFIACYRPNTKDIFKKDAYLEFIFSEESPWISAFGSKDTIICKDNYFTLTNMDADPTAFYSLMRLAGFARGSVYNSPGKSWKNPKAGILAQKTGSADPRRLAGQKPLRISGGTWAEGFGYTRPYNESIFKTELPTKFKEFGSLAGYPNAPYTNSYFISEMKKKFKIDFSAGIAYSEKVEAALVEAWDYFKEKAADLSDSAE